MVEIYWKPRSVTSFTATIISANSTSIFCPGSLLPRSEGKQRLRQVLSYERKRIDNRQSRGDAAGHDPDTHRDTRSQPLSPPCGRTSSGPTSQSDSGHLRTSASRRKGEMRRAIMAAETLSPTLSHGWPRGGCRCPDLPQVRGRRTPGWGPCPISIGKPAAGFSPPHVRRQKLLASPAQARCPDSDTAPRERLHDLASHGLAGPHPPSDRSASRH